MPASFMNPRREMFMGSSFRYIRQAKFNATPDSYFDGHM
ncbi:protein of unknown function [Maridesulfovibrio hydrothermalis AM13 = DSM 14728]|uniref:Uncharacterized protein n=1 Tax=Maridesulfovibrio hydrothermalis AM13 = DSM 14728 TaxID=1121451 RepID=L0RBJ0_9BACT|nr:protein of unknown function [Maridesulfovibrio hydrothermalis AM13 = DSM 14728]